MTLTDDRLRLIESSKQMIFQLNLEAAELEGLANKSPEPQRSYYRSKARSVRYMIVDEEMRLIRLESDTASGH